ncbi:MAG: hypothetical protein J6S00_06805 [Clostridia bacterium]|nr:hypothetical protein [Clostridia bacterium]
MSLYDIAGLKVNMDLRFPFTLERAKAYLVGEDSDTPDMTVNVTDEDLDRWIKRFKSDEFADQYEYMLAGSAFYRQLLDFDGMMLHSSAVVVDGKAYLFSAKSGTGKSTHTELWLKLFGDKAYILNDDKPAVRYVDGKLYAYGTPFSGKHDLSANTRAEVAGICFIERAIDNSIEQIPPSKSVPLMLEQTIRSNDITFMDKLLFVMDKLLTGVKVYKLCCNMDISAARLAYETMSNTEDENA